LAAGWSDAHLPDEQAAAEAGMNMSIAAMAGSSLIHNLGYLSAGRTGSLEILVLCDELANSVTRLARGIEVNVETLALDVIKRAALENNFVSGGHTYDLYLGEIWLPELFTRSTIEDFQISDQTPLRMRLDERVSEILRN
jgi:trimethylamine--corrinoid protein Co-methyltransferase